MFISTRKESLKNFTFARHTEGKRNPEKQKTTDGRTGSGGL